MRFFILLLLSTAAIQGAFANDIFSFEEHADSTKMVNTEKDTIYEVVEQMAEYPGGQAAMLNFIVANLKYPEKALDYGVEGTVVLEFIVEKDGSLSNFKVLKEIGGGCGNEALRVFNSMPLWKPGMYKNETVQVKVRAPIRFKISSPERKVVNPLDSIANEMVSYLNNRYPGGTLALSKLLRKNTLLPIEIKDGTIKGIAIFSVQVDAKGNHSNYQILRDVCTGCSKSIIEKLKMMPKWSANKKQKEPQHIIFPVHYNGDINIY